MDNNTYDQEIDLKDLLFAVFHSWRLIITIGLLFAVVLGGYKSLKELTHQNDEEYIAELKEQYNADELKYEQSKNGYERDIESLTASIAFQEKYKEDSILLKVDPYNKANASVDLFVKMTETSNKDGIMVTSVDPADSVVKAYASSIQQGSFLKDISKEMGIDIIYLKELINVTIDYDSNMLNVSVTYTDKEGAGKILDVILENLKAMNPSMQEHLNQHNLAVLNQDIGVKTDQILADYQKQKVVDLAATNKSLEDTEKSLKALVKPDKPVALSKLSIVKEGAKYGMIGCFAAAFLVAFYVSIVFLMNGKINSNDDIKDRFGLRCIGGFAQLRKKKVFSQVDMWLDKLEGRELVSDESMYDIISANIFGILNNGESIFLTGMAENSDLAGLTEEIQHRLPDIRIGYGTDMIHNVQTLKKLREHHTVILVEVRGQSKIKDIEKEFEIIHDMKKKIMGYIVINSYKSEVEI